MISPASDVVTSEPAALGAQTLVRYGVIPQVARYTSGTIAAERLRRGAAVVIPTDRGMELGELLEIVPEPLADGHESAGAIDRMASEQDLELHQERRQLAAVAFDEWLERLQEWQLELELMDVERTLDDDRYVLYVINDRGAETTRLALLAAAAGLGIISVQPVGTEGIMEQAGDGGGCGSGCGCGH